MTEETQHYESIEEATEAYQDAKAGIEHQPKEKEQKRRYENVDQALDDMREQQEANADAAKHVERTEKAESNEKSANETFELKGEQSEKIAQYQKEEARFTNEYQQFVRAAASIDWKEVEKSNPGEAAYLKQQMNAAQKALEQRYNALTEAGKGLRTEIAGSVLEKERAKLLEKAPELSDPSVVEELKDYMLGNGYTREEIEGAADHKLVLTAYRAMQSDSQPKAKGKVLYKNGKKAPEVPPNVLKAEERFNKSRSLGDYWALMDARAAPQAKTQGKSIDNKSKSRIAELQKVVQRNPNSRDALEAGAEMFALRGKAANA